MEPQLPGLPQIDAEVQHRGPLRVTAAAGEHTRALNIAARRDGLVRKVDRQRAVAGVDQTPHVEGRAALQRDGLGPCRLLERRHDEVVCRRDERGAGADVVNHESGRLTQPKHPHVHSNACEVRIPQVIRRADHAAARVLRRRQIHPRLVCHRHVRWYAWRLGQRQRRLVQNGRRHNAPVRRRVEDVPHAEVADEEILRLAE